MNYLDRNPIYTTAPFLILCAILTYWVADHIFFWDTVQLGAKHGLHFYETNFSNILLPNDIDSGHVPIFGMYLALTWKIFGKSLMVSHFAMLPFLFGIVIQAYFLLIKFISTKHIIWALLLFLLEPTLLGQAVLITPDILLVFFFLLGLNGVLNNQRWILTVGILGLFLISMRGSMVSLSLLVLDLYFNIRNSPKNLPSILKNMSLSYLPGFLLFCVYNYYHFYVKGWIGYHADSPWAGSFEMANFSGFVKNSITLIWRLFDFGRIFLWLVAFIILYYNHPKYNQDRKIKELLVILITVSACLSISFLTYKGLNAHRYLLPIYLIFSLLVIYMISYYESIKSMMLYGLLCLCLLTGHFWIYPSHISQGWDASLAHLSYYELREKINTDLQKMDISITDVACVFPNNSEQKYLDLSDKLSKHGSFDHIKSQFVLYSNVYNDFNEADVRILNEKFKVLIHRERMGIFITLFSRK